MMSSGKYKNFRIFALILAAVCGCSVFVSCAQTAFSDYENFFDDMDISVRTQDYLYKASNGDTSAFFYDELITFRKDLMLNPEHSDDARTVNGLFMDAVENIIASVDAARSGDKEKAQELLLEASLCYNNGNMRYQDFMAKYR